MTARVDPRSLPEVLRQAVLGAALYGPTVQVLDVFVFGEVWNWREAVVSAALFAAGAGLFLVVQVHLSAAARQRAAVARAVSAGVLPGGADREWLRRVTEERDRLRATRTGALVVSVFLAVLVAVATLLPEGPDGEGWLLAAGLVLFGGLVAAGARRRHDHADRLTAELEERLARV